MLHPRHWKDDKSVEQCCRCATVFTFLRRRHHCRHCGGVFCGPCAAQRVWLRPWPGGTAGERGAVGPVVAPMRSPTTLPSSQAPWRHHSNSLLSETSEHLLAGNEGSTCRPPSTSPAAADFLSSLSSVLRVDADAAAPRAASEPPLTERVGESPVQPEPARTSTSTTIAAPPVSASLHHSGDEVSGKIDVEQRTSKTDTTDGSRGSAVGLTSSSNEAESRTEGGCNPTPSLTSMNDCLVSTSSPFAVVHTALDMQAQPQQHQQPPPKDSVEATVSTPSSLQDASQSDKAPKHILPKPVSMGAVSACTTGSRQLSEGPFTSGMLAVSPTTVASDATPKTWTTTTPAAMAGFDGTTTSLSPLQPASLSIRGGSSSSETTFDAVVRESSDGQVGSITVSASLLINAAEESSDDRWPLRGDVSCTPAAFSRGSHLVETADAAVYADVSYRAEVDQRSITWYLCRVCRTCYDALLDAILEAHEQSPFHPQQVRPVVSEAAAQMAQIPPLWQYVRLSSSTQPLRPPADRYSTQQQQSLADSSMASTAPPGLASSSITKPRLSSAWARLRASISLPATPVTAVVMATPSTITRATAASDGGTRCGMDGGTRCGMDGGTRCGMDASPLPPPELKPHDLRRTRDSPSSAHKQLLVHRSAMPMTAAAASSASAAAVLSRQILPPAMGVLGLPARLYGPNTAVPSSSSSTKAHTNASAAAVPSDGSRYSSPTSASNPCESSVLSMSSASFQQASQQSTEVTSPPEQQQQQQYAPRTTVTPPRRRLISIGNSTGHIRQAVAIARRRRRVAVILIDERDALDVDSRPPNTCARSAQESRGTTERCGPQQEQRVTTPAAATATNAGRTESGVVSLSPVRTPVCRSGGVAGFGDANNSTTQQPGNPTNPSASIATPEGAVLEAEGKHISTDSPTATTERPDTRPEKSSQRSSGTARATAKHPGCRLHLSFEANAGAAMDDGDDAALRDLVAGNWLLPLLPFEAATPAHSTHHSGNSLSTTVATVDRLDDMTSPPGTVSRVPVVREEAGSIPPEPATAATTRPISCACSNAGSGSAPTPKHPASLSAAAPSHHYAHHHTLPAIMVSPESGICVLAALFRELGAATYIATTPATPVFNALTPTSAAEAAAASGSALYPALNGSNSGSTGVLLMDPMFAGGIPRSGWGTGPDSYAAQRQALVREMVMRQQRAAIAAAAAAAAATASAVSAGGPTATSPVVSPSAGNYVLSTTSYNLSSGNPSAAAAPRASGGLPVTPTHERVTASVNVFFQLRSPTETADVMPPSTAAAPPAATPPSINILPVTTQVEMIGIPIEVSAPSANTSPKTMLPLTGSFTSPRNPPAPNSVSSFVGGTGVAGVTRSFTLHEFLPQLRKLSTNLDGYVIVVLRCRSSSNGNCYGSGVSCTSNNASPVINAAAMDEGPHLSASRRVRRNSISGLLTTLSQSEELTTQLSDFYERDLRTSSMRLSEDGDSHPCSVSCNLGNSVSFHGPAAVNATTASSGGGCSGGAARTHEAHGNSCQARRRHRVTEPFGGQQLRLLYQQLQSCGVTQPALSVVDVCDDGGSSTIVESETSPGFVASPASPVNERRGLQCENIPSITTSNNNNHFLSDKAPPTVVTTSSPAEPWQASPPSPINVASSPSATSPVSSPASSVSLLTPAVQKAITLTSETACKPDRPEELDKLVLPSSLHATCERPTSADFTSSAATTTPTTGSAFVSGAEKHELRRLAAQEHAMKSLRAAAHQLGLPFSHMKYTARSATAALQQPSIGSAIVNAFPAESPLRNGTGSHAAGMKACSDWGGAGNVAAGNVAAVNSGALLSRGLESLVATMVYRDLTAQQQ